MLRSFYLTLLSESALTFIGTRLTLTRSEIRIAPMREASIETIFIVNTIISNLVGLVLQLTVL